MPETCAYISTHSLYNYIQFLAMSFFIDYISSHKTYIQKENKMDSRNFIKFRFQNSQSGSGADNGIFFFIYSLILQSVASFF